MERTLELTADARLPANTAPRWWTQRRMTAAWITALLLHAVVIAVFLVVIKRQPAPDAQSPPGVSVVFQNGGAPQTVSPPAQRQGPPTEAQAPPPAAPPPPDQADQQPEVNLNLPSLPDAELSQAPAPPAPRPAHAHAAPHRPAPQHYIVMNNMSYGNPAPPSNFKNGVNLQLSQSDLNGAIGQDMTIQGDVGADWGAELVKWVNQHGYYPNAAVEQGQQGDVTVQFTVNRAGKVSALHMLSSSGSPFLDQAWQGIFQGAQLPPFPPGTKDKTTVVTYRAHFQLIGP